MNDANGASFTQKEMLVRIDGKLDVLAGRVTTIEIGHAVHESSAEAHNAAEIARDLAATRRDVVKLGALIGGIVMVVNGVAAAIIINFIVK